MDLPGAQAREVELILQQLDALPTLSPIATRLLSISSAEDYRLDEVARLIESDPALTAKILGLCRRADKGLGDRITTVRRAIIMLGIESVRSAVLSISVYELLDRTAAEAAERSNDAAHHRPFDREGFWRHAIGVACAAELIAQTRPHRAARPEDAFVAGILHDLGKIVFDVVLPKAFARVLDLAERRHLDSAGIERQVIGIDHHLAGRRIASHWGLPQPLSDVMWLHSQPPEALPDTPSRPLVLLISLAKVVCRALHIGWSGDFAQTPSIDEACVRYGFNPEKVSAILPQLHASVADRCKVLGLGEEASPVLLLRSIFAANQSLARLNTMLERRTHAAQATRDELDRIGAFLESVRPGSGVGTVLEQVARSAREAIGPGEVVAVHVPQAGASWEVHRFHEDHARRVISSPPPDADDVCAHLTSDTPSPGLGIIARTLASLDPALSRPGMRLILLDPEFGGGWIALLGRFTEPAPEIPPTLLAAWRSAVASAVQTERASHLGERLVEANRSLAEAQARLTEAASMARLGEMTAGAAHEMNNPLTVISGRAQVLAARLAAPAEKAAAEAIVGAARDLTDLITSLNLLACPPALHAREIVVEEAIRSAVHQAEQRVGVVGRVRIETPPPSASPGAIQTGRPAQAGQNGRQRPSGITPTTIHADPDLLAQALCELVINALEAGGDDFVRVRTQTDASDDRLVISVIDPGVGMSGRALEHAFDPFFSEKPAGRQRGLGLTRARRLVELHGGSIELASVPGRGTTASIRLPARCAARTAA
ncbi:MAG: HDOD domain-containing protein [Phycisphaeraceae bacterium]|nr:HDOD domain-containing protein [Phycisphaeraceae bacterium]